MPTQVCHSPTPHTISNPHNLFLRPTINPMIPDKNFLYFFLPCFPVPLPLKFFLSLFVFYFFLPIIFAACFLILSHTSTMDLNSCYADSKITENSFFTGGSNLEYLRKVMCCMVSSELTISSVSIDQFHWSIYS